MKMALKLEKLDDITRKYMIEEIQGDVSERKVYISSRLNADGKIKFQELLISSAKSGNDSTLAGSLVGYFNEKESNGKGSYKSIPYNANVTLAEGEYNRYYIRALCRRAIIENKRIEVCRVRDSFRPRLESECRIGEIVDAAMLLEDLRNSPGQNTFLGIPGGVNSGLSVKLIDWPNILKVSFK